MPQVMIYLNQIIDQKIKDESERLHKSKHDVILKILDEYKFEVKK
jgi:hypothetical protein